MQRIKSILNPGHKKDDEILYAGGDTTNQPTTSSTDQTGTASSANTTGTAPQADPVQDTGAIKRQLLNPGGEKYDQVRYGPAGSNTEAEQLAADPQEQLHTDPKAEKKGHSILRQILNPGGEKYDPVRYGTTTSTEPAVSQQQSSSVPAGSQPTVGAGATHTTGQAWSHLGYGATIAGAEGVGAYEAGKNHPVQTQQPVVTSGSATATTQQAEGELPPVPADGGKFMGTGYESTAPSTAQRSFPLSGGSTSQPASKVAHISNLNQPASTTGRSASGTQDTSGTTDGREALAGAAGAATGAGAGTLVSRDRDGPSLVKRPHATNASNRSDLAAAEGSAGSATAPTTTSRASNPATSHPSGNTSTSNQPEPAVGGQHRHGHDVAMAGGTGAAVIGANKAWERHEENKSTDPTASTATSNPSASTNPTSQSSTTQSTQPSDRHYARDATATDGLSAAGIGAAEAYKHRENKKQTPAVGEQGLAYTEENPYSSRTLDPRVDAHPHVPGEWPETDSKRPAREQTKHHYGRDAAVAGGAGAAGAAGIAAYEADKVSKEHEAARDLPADSAATRGALAPTTASQDQPGTRFQREAQPLEAQTQQHPYGRDAAVAGGVGAAGVGTYEAEKHRKEMQAVDAEPATQTTSPAGQDAIRDTSASTTTTATEPAVSSGPAPRTIGPHDKDWKNILDPRVRPDPTLMKVSREEKRQQSERDAAVVGDAGIADIGTYEAEKKAKEKDAAKIAPAPQPTTTRIETQPQEEHHYARDAAIAGGAGAAGVGAYEAAKHHDQQSDPYDPTSGAQRPAAFSSYEGHRTVDAPPITAPGQGIRSDTIAQPGEHYYGRDAAIAGGAGAAGVGACEAGKHHGQGSGPLSTSAHPALSDYDSQRGAVTYPLAAPGQDTRTGTATQTEEHHLGRDAAVAGAAGAAGVGAYETEKHHGQGPDPLSTSAHPAVSGYDSQRAALTDPVTAPGRDLRADVASQPKEHRYERDAALAGGAGAAGVGAYQGTKHPAASSGYETQPATGTDATVAPGHDARADTAAQPKEHHYGRDAAIASGAGAAGASAYEVEKHHHDDKLDKARAKEAERREKEHQRVLQKEKRQEEKEEKKEKKGGLLGILRRDKDKNKDDDATSAPASPVEDKHQRHHKEDEAAVAGTAATAPVAEHEHEHERDKHHHHPVPRTSIESGRNRLHKDPPPDHPAAQAAQHSAGEADLRPTTEGVRPGAESVTADDAVERQKVSA